MPIIRAIIKPRAIIFLPFELKKYGKGLLDKERIIVLNKMELVDDDYLKIITKKLEDLSKKKVLVISSSLKKGLSSLHSEVWKRI